MHDFSKKYSRDEFLIFLKNILPNDLEFKNDEYKVTNKDSIITNVVKLAELKSFNDLAFFEVQHQSMNDPRVTLTRELFAILNKVSINYALVVFHSKDSNHYRFSYVESYFEWKNDSRVLKKFSKPKRLSFLIGENSKIHTPTNQFKNKILNLSDLKKRFDIEVVTEEFFKNYKSLYTKLKKHLEKDPNFNSFAKKINLNITVFAKKLLGQIVFCYFVQKKGWLGVKKNESFGKGDNSFLRNKFSQCMKEKKNFFNDVLEYLFYEGFNKENENNFVKELNSKIPYLNGGLFEELYKYDWKNENLEIPNKIFSNNNKDGILDIFDLYNFTVDENNDIEIDLAIDPEMLGKVFENLLEDNIREEKGAYYTPREVVFYMCRNSIINYLTNVFKDKLKKKDIVNLVQLSSGFFSNETLDDEKNKTLQNIKKNSHSLDDTLENIKICDPAVGSGAFPVALMNEVVQLRLFLSKLNNREISIQTLKKHFIKNSIYGVDLEPSAVEIAKLRLWLSLIVDVNDFKKIEPLPNLDYKIMQGDSLIDEYYGFSFDKKKENELFENDDETQSIVKTLFKKQQEYYDLIYPKVKRAKRQEVENELVKIFDIVLKEQLSKKKLSQFQSLALDKNINNIENDLKNMSKTYATRNFFFWKLYFSGVFSEKDGFDIVITNPPYVFTRDVNWTDDFKKFVFNKYLNFSESQKSGRAQSGKINLYVIFILQSLYLLNNKGVSCFIIPNGFLRSIIYPDVRRYLIQKTQFLEIVDLKPKAFKGVTVSPIIFLFDKTKLENNNKRNFEVIDADFAKDLYVSRSKIQKMDQLDYLKNTSNVFNITASREEQKILFKIKLSNKFLENIKKDAIEGIVAHKNLIYDDNIDNLYVPLLEGKSICPNYILNHTKYLKLDKKKIHRYRPEYIWKAEKKIIIRRISGGKKPLVCAVDEKKRHSFASTNLLLIQDQWKEIYNYEFLSLLINSSLMNFFYSKSFSNGSDLTVNIATTFLEKLPLPMYTESTKIIIKKISKEYSKLNKLNIELHHEKNSIKLEQKIFLEKKINDAIYQIYSLNNDEIFIIDSYFSKNN